MVIFSLTFEMKALKLSGVIVFICFRAPRQIELMESPTHFVEIVFSFMQTFEFYILSALRVLQPHYRAINPFNPN